MKADLLKCPRGDFTLEQLLKFLEDLFEYHNGYCMDDEGDRKALASVICANLMSWEIPQENTTQWMSDAMKEGD